MLSPETLQRYRQMTPGERLKLTFEQIEFNLAGMLQGTPEIVRRRFELLRLQNDDRNYEILSRLAKTRKEK